MIISIYTLEFQPKYDFPGNLSHIPPLSKTPNIPLIIEQEHTSFIKIVPTKKKQEYISPFHNM